MSQHAKAYSISQQLLAELEIQAITQKDDPSYQQIAAQIQFIAQCLAENKNINEEKGNRVLNFPIIAARNLDDKSDASIIQKIADLLESLAYF